MRTNGVEIIIVEDDPNDYELTTRVLRRRGLANTVRWFKDGAAFIDSFSTLRAEAETAPMAVSRIIILDIKLPKVGGLEVLKALKEDSVLKRIPVIVFTSSNQESDFRKAYSYYVNSYIVKPIDYDSYSHCIDEIISYWLFINKCA